jgi:hypothetical protein
VITREYVNQRLAEKVRRLSQPCPMPRCPAGVGQECQTPNGWATYHKRRAWAVANGGVEPPRKARALRLSDAQAQRIEWAAERGVYYAPDQYATLRGEAAERACADALERAGLVEQFDTSPDDERMFRLTTEGWKVYHTHRLVIRRFDESRHDDECPCRRPSPFGQVAEVNDRPEFGAAKSSLRARHVETQRRLLANVPLRDVTAEARGGGGATVLDLRPRLAARHGSTPSGSTPGGAA